MQNGLIVLNLKDEPIIAGSELTVARILERLSVDDSIEAICKDYGVTKEQVHAALSYAEMHLPQSNHYEALDSLLKAGVPTDDLDYSLLAENAGYFEPYTCSLHLLHRYRKRVRQSHSRIVAGISG